MSLPVDADAFLGKAERRLEDARVLREKGSTEGVCASAYFAMHDAAHAFLIAIGRETPVAMIKTHSGLIAAFGQAWIESKPSDTTMGRSLNRAHDRRLLADYSSEPPAAELAARVLKDAEAFLDQVRARLRQPPG